MTMSFHGNSVLPQELYDTILDHLAFDVPTLKACGTVCESFIPRTRTHLFQKATLTTETAILPGFIQCIAPYVQAMTISSPDLYRLGQHDFPRLATLHLNQQWFKQTCTDTVLSASVLRQIHTLSLTDAHFESMPHLVNFIASFSRLEALVISCVDCASSSSAPLPPAPATLKSLESPTTSESTPGTIPALLEWIARSHSEPGAGLEKLHVEWIDDIRDVKAIGQYLLGSPAQQLKELEVSFHPYGRLECNASDLPQYWLPMSATQVRLPNLARFTFTDLVIGSSAEATDVGNDFLPLAIRRLRDAVQSSPSSPSSSYIAPPLEITLNLRIAGLSQLGRLQSVELDWERLRGALEGESVKAKMVLSCDEEGELGWVTKEGPAAGDGGELAARDEWRGGVEAYFCARMGENAVQMVWDVEE